MQFKYISHWFYYIRGMFIYMSLQPRCMLFIIINFSRNPMSICCLFSPLHILLNCISTDCFFSCLFFLFVRTVLSIPRVFTVSAPNIHLSTTWPILNSGWWIRCNVVSRIGPGSWRNDIWCWCMLQIVMMCRRVHQAWSASMNLDTFLLIPRFMMLLRMNHDVDFLGEDETVNGWLFFGHDFC